MKYIKTYEKNHKNIKIGDYVLFKNHYENWEKTMGIISDVENVENSILPYYVDFYDPEGDKCYAFLESGEVIRLLTPSEIETYKMKEDVNKYNL